jgi:hypothetical protein
MEKASCGHWLDDWETDRTCGADPGIGFFRHAQTANVHGKARFDTVGIGANGPDSAKYATKLINDPNAFNTIPY